MNDPKRTRDTQTVSRACVLFCRLPAIILFYLTFNLFDPAYQIKIELTTTSNTERIDLIIHQQ